MRGAWLMLLLLLPTATAFDLHVPEEINPQTPLQATILLEQDTINSEQLITATINNQTYAFTAEELIQGNVTIIPKETSIGDQVTQKTITLSDTPQIALDAQDATSINTLSLQISATDADNVALNINNNIVWSYQGPLLPNEFAPLDTPYLENFQRATSVLVTGTDVYCQKTSLNVTEKFKIEAKVKQNDQATLLGIIANAPNTQCDIYNQNEQTQCCILEGITSSFGDASCTIDRVQQQPQEAYLCVAPQQTQTINNFSLAVEPQNDGPVRAYNGPLQQNVQDYLIRGYYNKFQTVLDTTVDVNVDTAQLQTGLIPLTLTGQGTVDLHNLNVEMQTAIGTQIKTTFTEIEMVPRYIQTNGTVELQLTIPAQEGELTINILDQTKSANITLTEVIPQEIELTPQEYVTQMLPVTQQEITVVQAQIPQDMQEILNILQYTQKLTAAQEQLTQMQQNIAINATNATYLQTQEELRELRATIIKDMATTTESYEAKVQSINDIPEPTQLQLDVSKQAIFASQQTNIPAQVYRITATYLDDSTETFALIKKQITNPSATIYELPNAPIKEILTQGYQVALQNAIYIWQPGTSEIIYTMQMTGMDAKTKTLLIPANVADFQQEELQVEIICGDGACNAGEICPEDCEPKRPWAWIIFAILFLVASVYYINFYKGPYAIHFLNKKPKGSVFRNSGDELAVTSYIKRARKKGFTDQQIRFVLKSKKWSEAQIRAGFQSTAKKSTAKSSFLGKFIKIKK